MFLFLARALAVVVTVMATVVVAVSSAGGRKAGVEDVCSDSTAVTGLFFGLLPQIASILQSKGTSSISLRGKTSLALAAQIAGGDSYGGWGCRLWRRVVLPVVDITIDRPPTILFPEAKA